MEENKKRKSGFDKIIMGFLFGSAVGSALGIVFAPKSGEETRKDIGEKIDEISTKIRGSSKKISFWHFLNRIFFKKRKMTKFTILTIFPDSFSYFGESIIKRAIEKKIIEIEIINIKDFSTSKHKNVDDIPYGGGQGMVLMCQPIFDAIDFIKKKSKQKNKLVIYTSPRGENITQEKFQDFSKIEDIEYIIICGRYEGIDKRIIDNLVDLEISVGEYILTGGEIPAMIFVDGITRLLEGVLGNTESHLEESFSDKLLGKKEFPYYTRPADFRGIKVPDVLISGNHKEIENWKKQNLVD